MRMLQNMTYVLGIRLRWLHEAGLPSDAAYLPVAQQKKALEERQRKEAEEAAKARGARLHGVLSGTGASQSWCDDTVGLVPDSTGESLADAIQAALRDAGLAPSDIDAVIPYGSGVPFLDGLEANALTRVFGADLARKPIITIAPSIGATCAGFGAIAVAVACRALAEQRLPARLNATSTGALHAVAAPSAPHALRHILVCTPSLGGQNSAAVISKPA